MKRRLVLLVALLVLSGIGCVAWTIGGLPPVRFILRYGLSPGCEPTGQTMFLEGVEFVEIGPGVFRMGSDHLAEGGDWLGRLCEPLGLAWGKKPKPSDEMPMHWVEIPRGFWIARTEITNVQYKRFEPGYDRSRLGSNDEHPAVWISWADAVKYCEWLAKTTGREVRLPSEAEWECACRAGSEREFCFGDDEERLAQYAWIKHNSGGQAHEVATRQANSWGLHDMHGNVWEWCEDTWHGSFEMAPRDGSARVEDGASSRVARGGSWINPALRCRSANRVGDDPADRFRFFGFRPVISVPGRHAE